MQKKKHKPGLLWITGLSGSGKTTISKMIYKNLKKNYSNIILLDGDKLRDKLKIKPSGSFSYSYRTKVGLQYVSYCNEYINHKNKFVIIAVMALISKVQKQYKKIKNNFDVFLDVPMSELENRDPKKLYKRFRNREIKNMSGLDLKFDKPKKPSLNIKWKKNLSAYKISKKILKLISKD